MKQSYLGIAAFIAVIADLLNVFYHSDILITLYSTIAAVLLFFSIYKMNNINRFIVVLLLIIGSVLFLFYEASFTAVLHSFGENLNLLGLFLLIPLFGALMSEAGYLQALQTFLLHREETHKAHPYRMGYLLTASMGSLLNLGSMPLVYNIGYESFSSFENKKFGLTLLRGFGFCMLWSPYFVNVGLILVLYDLSWGEIGGYGIILALVYTGIVLSFFPFSNFSDDERIENVRSTQDNPQKTSSLLKACLLYIVILLVLSFVMEALMPANMLTIVSIIAVIYPLVWAYMVKIFQSYIHAAVHHVFHSFERLYNEIGIFITAGFFGEALARSDVGHWLSNGILQLSKGVIPALILILMVTAMLLAFVGIHPVIIVLGLGSSLSPDHFGVSPAFMGVLLLSAWMLAVQISPFSGSVLMASNIMRESPWRVVRKNSLFIFTLMIIITLLLSLMHWMQLL
ncbi:TRAP transporter large permease subunit [Salibacterium salarium]|uniref:TRAP transporter large permease subunit n=1 Tax=Salibacterium salarium TaxID=284579 RepID=A0A3R9P5S3_9BACI|nr:TRAP transporter large permease subunit [Salibacterium salarium]RSL33395.1 TRAP transporter large permease subunit [Salibacterium salarium]